MRFICQLALLVVHHHQSVHVSGLPVFGCARAWQEIVILQGQAVLEGLFQHFRLLLAQLLLQLLFLLELVRLIEVVRLVEVTVVVHVI